ncbi:MAG: hypothetical protein CSA66_06370 [Proteobacteria bacterium]|nr:MAG: hypothetical protein CSA66_06370 [Pseudomonadota bacterium]
MPELPEVEIVRRNLSRWMGPERAVVRVAAAAAGRIEGDLQRLVGRRAARWGRRGKVLIGAFDGGVALLSHLGMSGKWVRAPAPRGYERIVVDLDDGTRLALVDTRRLGRTWVVDADAVAAHPRLAGLGPDPLADGLDGPTLRARVVAGRPGPLKTRLLDQARLAGFGNICVAEAASAPPSTPTPPPAAWATPPGRAWPGGCSPTSTTPSPASRATSCATSARGATTPSRSTAAQPRPVRAAAPPSPRPPSPGAPPSFALAASPNPEPAHEPSRPVSLWIPRGVCAHDHPARPPMSRWYGALGAAFGAVGVMAGAFGAHGLKEALSPARLAIWDTAAEYQLVHAVALVLAWLVAERVPGRAARVAGAAFACGVLVFCGSLYLLAVTDVRWLGAITPLGGVAFIVGWLALALALRPRGAGGAS